MNGYDEANCNVSFLFTSGTALDMNSLLHDAII